MKLKKLSYIRIGLPLTRKKGGVHYDKFFRYKTVTLKAFSSTGRLLQNELDEFIANEELNENYITQKGDILVRLREPNIAVYVDEESSGLLVPALMAIIKPQQKINGNYLTHYINSNEVQKRLHKELQGTTIQMLKASELADLEIILPSLHTQEKIVSILNLANQEIELIEELKLLKTQFKNEIFDTILKKEINK